MDVVTKEFRIWGRNQSNSRISVIAGLSRKEVKRGWELTRPDDSASVERSKGAARVIAAWRRESNFLDAGGYGS